GSLGIHTKIDFKQKRVAECYSTSSVFRGYSHPWPQLPPPSPSVRAVHPPPSSAPFIAPFIRPAEQRMPPAARRGRLWDKESHTTAQTRTAPCPTTGVSASSPGSQRCC
ncbi:hypothetical protein ACFXPH_09135, partial [Streptomyces goshikiensis]|uniref:hypothetical protein n=1 Tax=Streptomyces goshikiensis TaxID=1942 RepID=UPI00369DF48D